MYGKDAVMAHEFINDRQKNEEGPAGEPVLREIHAWEVRLWRQTTVQVGGPGPSEDVQGELPKALRLKVGPGGLGG